MKTIARAILFLTAGHLLCLLMALAGVEGLFLPAPARSEPVFPSSGLDVRSLARGGTVLATGGGLSSVFGNPATLRPTGRFHIGLEYLRDADTSDKAWVVGLTDTISSIRGAGLYVSSAEFAGFADELWGVAFAQSLGSTLTIGESFHHADFEDPVTAESGGLSGADVGLLISLDGKLVLGYVARNLYRSDKDRLNRTNAYGLGVALPMRIYVTADYEENPDAPDEMDSRLGARFPIWGALSGAAGYQDVAGDLNVGTAGLAWTDENGSLEMGISYDLDEERLLRFMWGFNINY